MAADGRGPGLREEPDAGRFRAGADRGMDRGAGARHQRHAGRIRIRHLVVTSIINPGAASSSEREVHMGMTIAEKILARAAGVASIAPGEIADVEVDTCVLTDMNFMPASWRHILKVKDPARVVV